MARQEKSTNKLNPHTLTDFQNFIFKDEDSNVLDYYRRTVSFVGSHYFVDC